MFTAVNLQVPSPVIKSNCNLSFAARRLSTLRLPNRALASLSFQSVNAPSETSTSSHFTSTVGSPPPSSLQLNFNQRHITVLNLIACVAFKKAAESVEKLMDVAREELPDTMAAVRLSGMELSDLTMELSDLGQGITQGVRSSTRAVRVAQERLSQMTNMAPSGSASVQEVATLEIKTQVPMVAKTARGTREAIVKSRSFFQNFCTLVRFSRMAFNYFSSRSKQ
ncbi:uncharacterized protein LOC131304179 isoform X3 [Rhododendron vialii]|uniref:uncharacterized protein LOC131304179 isoform X3 n=1 Tax=Rhododendron vialii TaxID=182163 RepID=UPI0026604423|nr:uncharacterized protein LOC131304179 isoform X3 [Rhododendron vialii]